MKHATQFYDLTPQPQDRMTALMDRMEIVLARMELLLADAEGEA